MKDKYIKNPNISDSILMGNFLVFFFSFPPPEYIAQRQERILSFQK